MTGDKVTLIGNENHAKGFFIEVQPDGTIVRGYSCCCCDDCVAMRAYQAYKNQYEFDNRPLDDPNKIDTRHVRRELKDKFRNLGMDVNRLPSNVTRI